MAGLGTQLPFAPTAVYRNDTVTTDATLNAYDAVSYTHLVTKDSPSAANADDSMAAPDGYVYVKVETGVSDDDYIAITSGLTAEDTVAYDSSYSTTTLAGNVQPVSYTHLVPTVTPPRRREPGR